jgi:hypothetical protein
MATVVYRNAFFAVNGVDLSDDVSELSVNYSSEMLDETAMGDTTRIKKGGLKNWSVEATFHQDFSASQVDATLFTLVGSTTCVEMRPNNACSTASNPSLTGIAVLESYPPMGGGVGSLLDAKASWQSAGTLNRASSS